MAISHRCGIEAQNFLPFVVSVSMGTFMLTANASIGKKKGEHECPQFLITAHRTLHRTATRHVRSLRRVLTSPLRMHRERFAR
jgi:hypothetical protein